MGVTGYEPEEALEPVEECASVDVGRASSLDACGSVVAK